LIADEQCEEDEDPACHHYCVVSEYREKFMPITKTLNLECIQTLRIQLIRDKYTHAINNIINAVAISPDNTKIAAVGDKFLHLNQWVFTIWDLVTGQQRNIPQEVSYPHKEDLNSLAFSADSKFIAIGTADSSYSQDSAYYPSLSFWSVDGMTPKYNTPNVKDGQHLVVARHPTERRFATVNEYGIIRLWQDDQSIHDFQEINRLWQDDQSIHDFQEIKRWEGNSTRTMIFSTDGSWLCTGAGKTNEEIKLWDASTGQLIRSFAKPTYQTRSLAFSPDCQTLVSGSNQRINIWDANTGELKKSFFGHPDWVCGLAITSDSRYLISAGGDKLKTWNLVTGQQLSKIAAHDEPIRSMDLSQDGSLLVTGCSDGVVKIWQLQQ
jgi:COMPASS component SWD3